MEVQEDIPITQKDQCLNKLENYTNSQSHLVNCSD